MYNVKQGICQSHCRPPGMPSAGGNDYRATNTCTFLQSLQVKTEVTEYPFNLPVLIRSGADIHVYLFWVQQGVGLSQQRSSAGEVSILQLWRLHAYPANGGARAPRQGRRVTDRLSIPQRGGIADH